MRALREFAAALAVVCAAAGPARAEEAAGALLARAFENLYADDYVQTLELVAESRGSRALSRTLQITRKQSVRPGKALVRFLEPFDVRRTSVLILENDGASDDLYVYLPALDLTRRISAAQRADAFFGTDLSYEDIEPKHAGDYVAQYLPRDAEQACVPVELRPGENFESTYERMVACIEEARALIHWMEFYRHGRAVKRLEVDLAEIREIGPRRVPFAMAVTTLRSGSRTLVRTESYELTGDISEKLFSTWNLQAGDAERDRSRANVGKERPGREE
jgi:hypothetical protein